MVDLLRLFAEYGLFAIEQLVILLE